MNFVKQKIKYLVPVRLKKALKYTYYSLQDFINFIKGQRTELPPKRLNFVGSSEFARVANEFFGYFKGLGDLEADDIVLDIGCGIGRMALPITKYLDEKGKYRGFDIDLRGIKWCKKNITPKYKNFEFEYVDLFNKYYNKKGKLNSSEFNFPYSNDYFTFAFATSVFTHMLPADITHYLEEISRVLKPGGCALITFFSIDSSASENIKKGVSHCNFKFPNDENSFYSHKNVKEAEIGYKEDWIKKQISLAGLNLSKIFRGSWSGRKDYLSYQDIYIIKK